MTLIYSNNTPGHPCQLVGQEFISIPPDTPLPLALPFYKAGDRSADIVSAWSAVLARLRTQGTQAPPRFVTASPHQDIIYTVELTANNTVVVQFYI